MFLADYHLHSKYSFDGHESLEAICERAIEQGMNEIAVTDHCDIYSNKPYTYILDCRALYSELREVAERYSPRLKVRIGAELGQPQANPVQARQFLSDYDLDFVIGSVHNMENDTDIYYYDFAALDCVEVYDHYVDWLMELAINYDYDVIGHITYPLRYMTQRGFGIDIKPFEEKIRALYKIIIGRGKGIELNVSGLYRENGDTMPSFEMLKWYRECGGEIITAGSDAHYLEHVGLPIRQGMELIRRAGFGYITTFEKRKPNFVKICG